MRIVRSWPATIPEGRSYVIDGLERLPMLHHDYAVLDRIDDDVLILEWDIAVGREELALFIDRIKTQPKRVLVAPYRLYVSSSGRPARPAWSARRYLVGETRTEWVEPGDEFCHLFGLGMTYLPRPLVKAFLSEWDGHFNDVSFSAWHYRTSRHPDVTLMWQCQPTHVHYDIAAMAAEVRTTA